MAPFHPLAADADVAPAELALAQGQCALTLGRLDGLLVGLKEVETALFCLALVREALLTSLIQAGFSDAPLRFDAWFTGLDRAPQDSARTGRSATALVRALLTDFGHHAWAPLASAAQTVAAAARFAADPCPPTPDAQAPSAPAAVAQAADLVQRAGGSDESALPFAALARLHALLRADPLFAPAERALRHWSLGGRAAAIAQAAPPPPLWAVDAALGQLLQASGTWARALPCPGAMTAEALQPPLWPGERALLAARSLHLSVKRLTLLVDQARRRAALMDARLGHLRSSARAPGVWRFIAAFAPLGLDPMAAAFQVSRRGTYAIGDALTTAGLAQRERVKGKFLLIAQDPPTGAAAPPLPQLPAPAPAIAEFDAAMAEIDRLLERRSR